MSGSRSTAYRFLQKAAIERLSSGASLVEGVLMERRVLDVVLKAADDRRRSRAIGVADSEVDHVAARGDGGLLLLVDLGEQIRGKLP